MQRLATLAPACAAGLALFLTGCTPKVAPPPPPVAPPQASAAPTPKADAKTEPKTDAKADAKAEVKAAPEAKPSNATCPVEKGNKVNPKIVYEYKGKFYGFCCADCVPKFKADPEKYIAALAAPGGDTPKADHDMSKMNH